MSPSRSSRSGRRSPALAGDELVIPIKHGEGNSGVDDDTYAELLERGQIVLRYVEDVNGSRDSVAGVANEAGNVLGLMPHRSTPSIRSLGQPGGSRSSRA